MNLANTSVRVHQPCQVWPHQEFHAYVRLGGGVSETVKLAQPTNFRLRTVARNE
jgi:hypothetical protein